MAEEGSKLDIYLSELLKTDLPAEVRAKACYNDHVGRDGFSNHLLETVLCVMETSDEFNCDFTEFPEEDDTRLTVKELVQFVIRKNFRVIQN